MESRPCHQIVLGEPSTASGIFNRVKRLAALIRRGRRRHRTNTTTDNDPPSATKPRGNVEVCNYPPHSSGQDSRANVDRADGARLQEVYRSPTPLLTHDHTSDAYFRTLRDHERTVNYQVSTIRASQSTEAGPSNAADSNVPAMNSPTSGDSQGQLYHPRSTHVASAPEAYGPAVTIYVDNTVIALAPPHSIGYSALHSQGSPQARPPRASRPLPSVPAPSRAAGPQTQNQTTVDENARIPAISELNTAASPVLQINVASIRPMCPLTISVDDVVIAISQSGSNIADQPQAVQLQRAPTRHQATQAPTMPSTPVPADAIRPLPEVSPENTDHFRFNHDHLAHGDNRSYPRAQGRILPNSLRTSTATVGPVRNGGVLSPLSVLVTPGHSALPLMTFPGVPDLNGASFGTPVMAQGGSHMRMIS